MARLMDLGTRIELLPEDRFFRDISIALYRIGTADGPWFKVHSYARYDGTDARLAYVRSELCRLGGLVEAPSPGYLQFPCGQGHEVGLRRLFIRICRRDPSLDPAAFSLTIFDKKAECDIVVTSLGAGGYRVGAADETPMAARRIRAVHNGLLKLTQMVASDVREDEAAFTCGRAHDGLVAALLPDALNVRSATREQDALRAGGVLTAPGRGD